MEILKQGVNQPMSVEKQVVPLYTAVKGHLDDIPVKTLHVLKVILGFLGIEPSGNSTQHS